MSLQLLARKSPVGNAPSEKGEEGCSFVQVTLHPGKIKWRGLKSPQSLHVPPSSLLREGVERLSVPRRHLASPQGKYNVPSLLLTGHCQESKQEANIGLILDN